MNHHCCFAWVCLLFLFTQGLDRTLVGKIVCSACFGLWFTLNRVCSNQLFTFASISALSLLVWTGAGTNFIVQFPRCTEHCLLEWGQSQFSSFGRMSILLLCLNLFLYTYLNKKVTGCNLPSFQGLHSSRRVGKIVVDHQDQNLTPQEHFFMTDWMTLRLSPSTPRDPTRYLKVGCIDAMHNTNTHLVITF